MSHGRFFLDHDAIHDRMTGKHVGMQAEIDWQPRLLSLLNDMWEQITALERSGLKAASPAAPDDGKDPIPNIPVSPSESMYQAAYKAWQDDLATRIETPELIEHYPEFRWRKPFARTWKAMRDAFLRDCMEDNRRADMAPQGWQQGAAREIASILDGIDRTQADNEGWWETSAGAEFGARILERIYAVFKRHQEGKA